MMSFLDWGESVAKRSDGTGRDSGNLLERFWAAVNFDSHDSADDTLTEDEDIDHVDDDVPGRTPEIFAKSGSSPIIDISSLWSYKPPTSPVLPIIYCSCEESDTLLDDRKFEPSPSNGNAEIPNALDISESISRVIRSTPRPTSSARRSPYPTKLSTNHYARRQPSRAPSPATSLLAMASSFLDNIVKLTHSRSGTPRTTISVSGEGDIQIVESEVFINVIDDGKRAGVSSPSELQGDNSLVTLDIPPLPTLSIIPASTGNYDLRSPTMLSGPAGCAQELDALSWMSWERQLSNMHATLWH